MVRVLHLVSGLRAGGKERVALELCRAGNAAGHDDRVAVFEHRQGSTADELDHAGLRVHSEAVGSRTLPRLMRLARLVRTLRPEAVHAHNDSALVLIAGALALPRVPRCRAIATLHNMPVRPRARDRARVRAAARRADAVVCVSEDLRERRLSGGWIETATVIHNGVDPVRFSPTGPALDLRLRLGVDDDHLIVGMVARLDAGKRQDQLLEAAAREAAAGRPAAVVLIGDGPRREELLAGAPPSVPLLHLPHVDDVSAGLRGLDVAVLASDHEGLPMSLLEAMSCGRPVLGSDVGGIRELLGRDELFPEGDTEALAAALGRLRAIDARQSAGQAALRRATGRFGLAETVRRYSAVWQPS